MTDTAPLFLALDQGGHASRAFAFDRAGNVVASAERRIATLHPGRDRVEHHPAALLASVDQVCQAVLQQLGKRRVGLTACGLATQRSTVVCWDRHTGEALSPVISWQDRRAAGRLAQLAPLNARIHAITGLRLSPHYGAGKIAWCLENLKPVGNALREDRLAVGPLASFILARRLIEKPLLIDPVNASRTLLWDHRSHDWSGELLRQFRIPAKVLPRSVPNRYPFGNLRLGSSDLPMTVVTGDQSAALYAGGMPSERDIHVNIGTGAFIQRLHDHTPSRATDMLSSVLWQSAEQCLYVMEGTVNGAGSAITWLSQRLDLPESAMLRALPDLLAAQPEVPLFLNGVSGLGSPYWIPGFQSRFIGRGTPAQKMVAIVESVVFLVNLNVGRMRRWGLPPRHIVVSGGLARWDGLCQRLANLSGLKVHRRPVPEATAAGLGWLLGARAPGKPTLQVFRPADARSLKRRYRCWLDAMQAAVDGTPRGF